MWSSPKRLYPIDMKYCLSIIGSWWQRSYPPPSRSQQHFYIWKTWYGRWQRTTHELAENIDIISLVPITSWQHIPIPSCYHNPHDPLMDSPNSCWRLHDMYQSHRRFEDPSHKLAQEMLNPQPLAPPGGRHVDGFMWLPKQRLMGDPNQGSKAARWHGGHTNTLEAMCHVNDVSFWRHALTRGFF